MANNKKSVGALVEDFIVALEADIDSQVRDLSLERYGTWLAEFKSAVNASIDSRLEAQREDLKSS